MLCEELNIVEFNQEFLDLSWNWLNDPIIKELTMTPDFTKEEQLKFFKGLPRKNNFKIWGLVFRNIKIGVIGLKNITNDDSEYFGYIGDKRFWNKGLSEQIFKFIFRYTISIGNKYLYLKVADSNERAIKAYKKNGFFISDESDLIIMKKEL